MFQQWIQGDWFHRRDDLLFKISVNGGVFSEQCLILLEILSSKRLFLGVYHGWRVISQVAQWHKRKTRL